MSEVYLDHHSATRPLEASIDAWLFFLQHQWGSTTSIHQKGQELIATCLRHVEILLEELGAKKTDRFYLFSSHAEAIEYLYFTYYREQIRHTGKNHILTTAGEEAAILLSLQKLEDLGCPLKMIPLSEEGNLSIRSVKEAINPRTALLSLSWANGLTGVIQPIEQLAAVCQEKQIAFHVDASYAIGKVSFSFEESGIDFLTFDGSLLHAPKGSAGLLIKDKTPLSEPLSVTTGLNVGALAALSKAISIVQQKTDTLQLETARLTGLLEKGIIQGFPQAQVLFKQQERLPNCTVIAFPGIASDALLFLLNRKKIYASLGGGYSQKLSHLLISSHINPILAHSALSFSLSFETTQAQVEEAISVIVNSAKELASISAHLEALHEFS